MMPLVRFSFKLILAAVMFNNPGGKVAKKVVRKLTKKTSAIVTNLLF